jgi:membrane associated rhomboid family serine protease
MTPRSIYSFFALPLWVIIGMLVGYVFQLLILEGTIPGVIPRTVAGLAGIGLSPWWHGDIEHLSANVAAAMGLLTFLSLEEPKYKTLIFIIIYIFTNILVWLFARQVNHIGMSGVLYGVSGFIMTKGFLTYNVRTMVIAMLTIIFYGGTFYAILPFQEGVSWESHLFGFITGSILAIYLYKNNSHDVHSHDVVENKKDFESFIRHLNEKDS